MKKRVTTHLQGILTNPMNEPYNNAEIVVEMTDADDSFIGLRSSRFTDTKGNYYFTLQEGYYNIYIIPNEDATEVKMGKVHVTQKDFNTSYTIEGLINK
jgi:hypothetical protein